MPEQAASVKDVFERTMPERLRSRPEVVSKIGSVYQFVISGPNGGTWTVDCTKPGGEVRAGSAPDAKCTVSCSDTDFVAIANGKLGAQMAFMAGKLRIQGDMALALKLQQILS